MISAIRSLILLSAASSVFASVASAGPTEAKKTGYFVSIDGTNPAMLDVLLQQNILKSRFGYRWLHNKGVVVDRANPGLITITAPSHVSTITCSPPSRHGIVGNSFYQNGQMVSGFGAEFASEPFWISAKREGKKVMALAYVGADASTEKRTADYSLAYPSDSQSGASQTVELDLATLPAAADWNTGRADRRFNDLHEAQVQILINPKTSETKTIEVLVAAKADLSAAKVYLDDDKDLTNGYYGVIDTTNARKPIVNAYFIEQDQNSELIGVKRRSFFRLAKLDSGKLSFYVSKASYNNAYPESFRKMLDDANLVWPDYGYKIADLTPEEYVEGQTLIDRFLTEVAVRYTRKLDVNVLLFYQPIVDSVGHKLQSALPMPFNPKATDDVTRTFVLAYKVVDENLSRIFSKANMRRDVFAVMGDHGMDPIFKSVNIAKFLPADHADKVIVHSSGSLTLIYPNIEGPGALEDKIAAARDVGAQLKQNLTAARDGANVFLDLAVEKGVGNVATGHAANFADEWQYGDAVWAFSTKSGYWFQYRPLEQDVFLTPPALGMHGQSLDVTTMATRLVFKAPGLKHQHVAKGSLLNAIPTFAELMGMQTPADCVGKSMVPELH